ncbi:unnamed protein product [Prorocentrum cordatum]|uniref:Uncharacterized protein n=1 Tax=Prorocentrum cordatum TaxID=2364126 RepID=A0ABN9UTX1_9DINO|nr:unnamed protein product [Polarella glacialis]
MAVPGGGAFQADFGRRGVELEERGAAGAGAPFVELGGLSDEAEEVQEPDARAGGGGAGQRRARGSGPWRRPLPAAERLRQAFGRRARAAQAQVLSLLHLLTCSLTTYFFEHLSPRNVIFLAMSAGVWLTAWLTLEPTPRAGPWASCTCSPRARGRAYWSPCGPPRSRWPRSARSTSRVRPPGRPCGSCSDSLPWPRSPAGGPAPSCS